jgi:hypothetical protein
MVQIFSDFAKQASIPKDVFVIGRSNGGKTAEFGLFAGDRLIYRTKWESRDEGCHAGTLKSALRQVSAERNRFKAFQAKKAKV